MAKEPRRKEEIQEKARLTQAVKAFRKAARPSKVPPAPGS